MNIIWPCLFCPAPKTYYHRKISEIEFCKDEWQDFQGGDLSEVVQRPFRGISFEMCYNPIDTRENLANIQSRNIKQLKGNCIFCVSEAFRGAFQRANTIIDVKQCAGHDSEVCLEPNICFHILHKKKVLGAHADIT